MTTREQLSKALNEITASAWQSTERPVLLSNLPPLLIEKLPEYRELLNTQSLKQFIQESEVDQNYKLVQHPTQRAKLGLLPKNASYEFTNGQGVIDQSPMKVERSSEKALIDFLRALKKLSPSELTDVQIPVSVIVKLLK